MANQNIYLEHGSTGLTRFGGQVSEEWLSDLRGTKGIKVYREMRDNDPVIGSILFAIKMLIRQAAWRVELGGDSPADKEAAEFLESCLYDMSMTWHDTLTEILSFLPFGWSYHEIVYKRRLGDSKDPTKRSKHNDGRIGWRKIPIRSQETLLRWVFDEEGGIQAMEQSGPPDYQLRTIPIQKALLFRTEATKNNPEGRSVLRNAYRPWYFKKNIEEIEGIGIERDLAGLPVALVPPEILSPSATDEQKALLSSISAVVTSIRRDSEEGIIFPAEETTDLDGKTAKTGYKLHLLTSGGRRQFDTTEVIQRYEQRMAMTVLADFIMLGHQKTGTHSLGDNKTKMFSVAIGAFLDEIAEVFNAHAIPRLFALNSFPGLTALPELVHGDVESPDLQELGEFIKSMNAAGFEIGKDEELENHLRGAANLPLKPTENRGEVKPTNGEPEETDDPEHADPEDTME
ncbi:phage portal protein family protein [Tumebacillus permanentifrigoris]|uniref:SPP1 Gp6-like portal protein n=1 Tax=Tumebacillus permanentifrigoris TaxID=378543 RepID=A0A316D5A8_9BACL|nr:hypothetical protein [Tumebacillus permanentifrigoris]PWK07507.1 hypothetical protein C7459_117106 [Tumebacillus permanentifrigoris]